MTDKERRIRDEAYRIWEDKGRPAGDDHAHWHEAEKRVSDEEAGKPKPAKAAKPLKGATVEAKKVGPKPAAKKAAALAAADAGKAAAAASKGEAGAKPKAGKAKKAEPIPVEAAPAAAKKAKAKSKA